MSEQLALLRERPALQWIPLSSLIGEEPQGCQSLIEVSGWAKVSYALYWW